jgi:hypothetical protein
MIIEKDALLAVKRHGTDFLLLILHDSFINVFLHETKTKGSLVKEF